MIYNVIRAIYVKTDVEGLVMTTVRVRVGVMVMIRLTSYLTGARL